MLRRSYVRVERIRCGKSQFVGTYVGFRCFFRGHNGFGCQYHKYTAHVRRPDKSNYKSFPSGHTATAFMAAMMMHKEYGDRSPWYSISAFTVATATGISRILNNRHWLSDVLAGAGIGILSDRIRLFIGRFDF